MTTGVLKVAIDFELLTNSIKKVVFELFELYYSKII